MAKWLLGQEPVKKCTREAMGLPAFKKARDKLNQSFTFSPSRGVYIDKLPKWAILMMATEAVIIIALVAKVFHP
jgi:hypothetical protein